MLPCCTTCSRVARAIYLALRIVRNPPPSSPNVGRFERYRGKSLRIWLRVQYTFSQHPVSRGYFTAPPGGARRGRAMSERLG